VLLNIIKQFNWVDILFLVILLRTFYIGSKNGLPVELFKLLGTVAGAYLAFHYYTSFADFIGTRLNLTKVPLEFLDFICFVLWVTIGYMIFWALRGVFSRVVKTEAVPRLNRWGGFALSSARGVLLTSLIGFMLVISSISYLKASVKDSYSGKRLFKFSPSVYTHLWNGVMSKFMVMEKLNQAVVETQEKF